MRARLSLTLSLTLLTAAACLPAQQISQTTPARPKAPLSTALTMTISGKTTTFSVADLEALPQKTLKLHNEHTSKDESYTGPLLADVLAKCGVTLTPATQKMFLHSTVRAIGTDQYFVLYSAAEVEPGLHAGDILVATKMDNGSLGADGNLKLISSEDLKPARWVRNLTDIVLHTED